MDVGPTELLIVLVIALVIFGGKKIPELARSLGQAKKEFEKGSNGETDVDAGDATTVVAERVSHPDVGDADSSAPAVSDPPQSLVE